jgi:hypothetical protein
MKTKVNRMVSKKGYYKRTENMNWEKRTNNKNTRRKRQKRMRRKQEVDGGNFKAERVRRREEEEGDKENKEGK